MKLTQKIFSTGLAFLWLAMLIVIVDRFSKIWVVQNLTYHDPWVIFPMFNLTLAYNKGAAFSFLDQASGWQNLVLGSLAGFVSLLILYWLFKLPKQERVTNIGLCCVLGGALGNAWDRMLHGYVIDFLSFHWGDWYFAIFNIADSTIFIGAALLFCRWFIARQ